jgi:hypothetical protein
MLNALVRLIACAHLLAWVILSALAFDEFGIRGLLVVAAIGATLWLWAEQARDWPRVLIVFGRDFTRNRHRALMIAWALRSDAEPGEFRYQRAIEASWDWLPVLFYRHVYDRSRQWTGRHRQLATWSWWAVLTLRSPERTRYWHAW